jgi:hypothetical protein
MKWLLVGFLLSPTLLQAFEPLNTDDAGTVVAGGNQIEQYFYSINRNTGSPQVVDIITPGEEYSGNADAKAFPFTYTRGLTDTVEASFSTTYFNQPSGNFTRLTNYVFASKWRFHEDTQNRYALAIKPMVVLPASKQQQVSGLGLASFNYGANLIASKYWEDIELHANASYMHSPYNTNFSVGYATDNNRTNIVLLSLAPVWTVSRGFRVALDVGATTNPNMTEQYLSYYSMLGAIYSINDSLDLGLSYMRVALSYGATLGTQTAGSTRSEVGLTWRF